MNGRPKQMVGQTPKSLLARPLYQPVCDEAGRDGDGYHGNDQQVAGKQAAKIDTAAIAIAAADLLDKHGITGLWVFLIGGPDETAQTVEETLSFIEERIRSPHAVYITSGIRVYPGSPIGDDAEAGLFVKEDLRRRVELPELDFFYSHATPPDWLEANWTHYESAVARVPATAAEREIVRERIDALMAFDGSASVPALAALPTLVVGAADDMIVPAFLQRDLAAALPGSQLMFLESGGHFFPISRSADFAACVSRWLAGDQ